MHKLLTVILIPLLYLGLTLTADIAEAQTQPGDFKLGVGLTFGSGVGFGDLDNDFGVRADAFYSLTPEIRAGGDFTFYFPKSEGSSEITVWELNFNGNYIFLEEDELRLYGLAGINITGFSSDFTIIDPITGGTQTASDSDTEVGLNLGSGLEYDLDFAALFGELKLGGLGGDADQFTLSAGLRFSL